MLALVPPLALALRRPSPRRAWAEHRLLVAVYGVLAAAGIALAATGRAGGRPRHLPRRRRGQPAAAAHAAVARSSTSPSSRSRVGVLPFLVAAGWALARLVRTRTIRERGAFAAVFVVVVCRARRRGDLVRPPLHGLRGQRPLPLLRRPARPGRVRRRARRPALAALGARSRRRSLVAARLLRAAAAELREAEPRPAARGRRTEPSSRRRARSALRAGCSRWRRSSRRRSSSRRRCSCAGARSPRRSRSSRSSRCPSRPAPPSRASSR